MGSTTINVVLSICAGIMLGASVVILTICWGSLLLVLDLRQALGWIAIMMACASLLQLLLASVRVEIGLPVFLLLTVIGVSLPVIKSYTHGLQLTSEKESDKPFT